MHSGYLTKEAFIPVEAIKDSKTDTVNDYKALYGDSPLIPHYFKEKKKESKDETLIRQQFKDQFGVLIDALKKWAKENGYEEHTLTTAEQFKTKLFNEHYSGNQTNEYFDAVKQFLEHIWFALNNKNISDLRKKSAFDHLIQNAFSACSPGVYGHLENILFVLNADISLTRWLAEMRTNLIRMYADQHIAKYNIGEGYWVHVHNGYMMYALNDNWAPISTIHKNNDPYLSNCRIDSKDITQFAKHLESHYTPKAIIECFTANFTNELRKLQKAKGFESKNDWFPYSQSYLDCADGLLNQLGLKIKTTSIFDIDDAGAELRFNPSSFKLALLNYFKESKRFFDKSIWKVKKLKNGSLYHYLDDGVWDVAWLENAEDNRLIETEIERFILEVDTQPAKWSTQHKNKLRDSIQSNGEKLGKLLNLFDKNWNEVFDSLGVDYLKNMLNSAQEVEKLLEQLPVGRRIELKPILSHVEDSIFLQCAKQKNTAFIKKLITEVQLTSRAGVEAAVECGDLPFIKDLMRESKIDVNVVNKERTLLSIAVNQQNSTVKDQLALVKYLVEECKADVNVHYAQKTILQDAAQLGRLDVVKLISQEIKSDPTKKESLILAARHNQFEVVKWLVQEANWDPRELTLAADAAEHNSHYHISEWLNVIYPIRRMLANIHFDHPKDMFEVGDLLENYLVGKPVSPIKSKYAHIITELCTHIARVSFKENIDLVARNAEMIIREFIENIKSQKINYFIKQIEKKPDLVLKLIVKIPPANWSPHLKYILMDKIKNITTLGKLFLTLPNKENWSNLAEFLGYDFVNILLKKPGALEKLVHQIPKEERHFLKPVLEMCDKNYLQSVLGGNQLPLLKILLQDVKLSKASLFYYAASKGNIDTVRLLIQEGVSVDARNSDGDTVLNLAAREGHLELVRYLVKEAKANLYNTSFKKNETVLSKAKLDVVRWLVLEGGYVPKENEEVLSESQNWVKTIELCLRKLKEAKCEEIKDFDEFCFTFIKLIDPKIEITPSNASFKYVPVFHELLKEFKKQKELSRSDRLHSIIYKDMLKIIKKKIHEYMNMTERDKKLVIELQETIAQKLKEKFFRYFVFDLDQTLEVKPEVKPVPLSNHVLSLFAPRNHGEEKELVIPRLRRNHGEEKEIEPPRIRMLR